MFNRTGTVFTTLHFLYNLLTYLLTYNLQPNKLFQNTKLERLTNAKHSNLLDQFVSYEQNEAPGPFGQCHKTL
jgi:hypothetical protein